MIDYEKLGVFYMGKPYDLAKGKVAETPFLYESKDLVTHAVCVGMTGSGKTGLCIALLEEAAIDGIPAIVIDPKGDLSNLLLTFPQLRGEDFAPWINEDDARREGVNTETFADQQAAQWKKGLGDWQQDGARIEKLRQSADFAVYTPGSSAGLPVSILQSFAAPSEALRADAEAMRDRTSAAAASLLGLVGREEDPLRSPVHLLLTSIFNNAWTQGNDLDLASIIQQIQKPPMQRIGMMELETVLPEKERFALAMELNNVLAAPGFAAWLQGEPLDLATLLYTPQAKPRIAIFSIAHLNDTERMFFVSLLLQQTLSWVRQQPGTTSLRALVYMDEIFGYFPPVKNPPSKLPLLTLLKQARAFGVGMVLATQNPVDLDYKGLANAGTWFIGRLQTERDKARLLEGLEGAAAGDGRAFDRGRMEQILAGLGKRVFLMNNVHDDGPTVFQTRWTLSYLRGPLTRQQIKTLMGGRKTESTAGQPAAQGRASTPFAATDSSAAAPLLPPGISQFFLPSRQQADAGAKLVYRPALLGRAKVYYADSKTGVDHSEDLQLLAFLDDKGPAWDDATIGEWADADLDKEPTVGATFTALPSAAAKAKSFDTWKKSLTDALYRSNKLVVFKSKAQGETSRVGESEAEFRIRLQHAGRETRDAQVAKLRQSYAGKIATLHERIRKAEQAVERESEQSSQSKWQTALSFGATLISALFSRKMLSSTNVSKATTAVRGVGRSMKESADVDRAQENVDALNAQLADLESRLQEDVAALSDKMDPTQEELQEISIKPKKSNINAQPPILIWAPHLQNASGELTGVWQ